MPINSEILRPLDHDGISGILCYPGVVALVIDDEEVAFLEAKSLRDVVRRIFSGDAGPRGATHFRVYTSQDPVAKKEDLLALFELRYGRLPRLQNLG